MSTTGNHSSFIQKLEHDDTGGVNRKKVSSYLWDPVNLRPVKQLSDSEGHAQVDLAGPLDMFGNLSVVNRNNVIELKSTYGLSVLRDVTTTAGSGTVTNTVGSAEYTLSTSTTTGSIATLDSAERGRYVPGTECEAGLGVRFPSQTYTGTAYAEWGYFDDNNGFGFGVDASGNYVFVKRNGNKTKTYQSNWNVDKFDGTGDSALTLDLEDGNIFQMDYTWYGYGTIDYAIVTSNGNNRQKKFVLHRFNPVSETSVIDPNLPLRAIISNGNTTTDYDMYVAGRQYSIYSPFTPNNRINSERRLTITGIGTTYIPTISFRKKTAYKSVAVKLEGLDIISDADLLYQVRLSPTLTGASYGTPSDTTATETACEVDVSATAITGGSLLTRGFVGTSGSVGLSTGSVSTDVLRYAIPEEQHITLALRRLSGSNGTASVILRWREEW